MGETTVQQMKRDFESLLKDYRGIRQRLGRNGTRHESNALLEILADNLKPDSLRFLTFCLNDELRLQARAVLLDDVNGAARKLKALERLVNSVRTAGIEDDLYRHYRAITRAAPISPDAEVRPIESVDLRTYMLDDGTVMGHLKLNDGEEAVGESRERISAHTTTAAMIVDGVTAGCIRLQRIGVSEFQDHMLERQGRALVRVARAVRQCCDVLDLDWTVLVRAAESGE